MKDELTSQTAVINADGDLTASRLPALRSQLRALVALGVQNLTLDLEATQQVDSAGIGLLISAHNSLRKTGGAFTVIHASEDLLALFQTMRMHQHFTVSGVKD